MTSGSGLRGLVFGCVSDHSSHSEHRQQQQQLNAPLPRPAKNSSPKPLHKVKFGVPLSESVRDDCLPVPLVDMLVYIAQEGVTTTDLFRRGGNPTDLKIITKRLMEGKAIEFNNYNFYTLASVIKKFLLKIPGGVLGPKVERKLLDVLLLDNRMQQYDSIHSIISNLPPATQQLLALLFGTWFRIVNHSEYNTMSSEAMAKSVAGSLFHTCNDDPVKVETAVQVLQILIDDFGVANMFGRKNIQYFADKTRTGIRVREKFCYEFNHPMEGSTQSRNNNKQGGKGRGEAEDSVDDAQLEAFALLLQKEAQTRGFRIPEDAITEEEFYGGSGRATGRRATEGSHCDELGVSTSTPPSPQSLQPHPTYHDNTTENSDYNPHKKLTHVSSLSAPEVNKGYSPTTELSPAKRFLLSTSLSRFDNVRRRQLLLMKKRTNWFLSPNSTQSAAALDSSRGSDSMLGSAEGKSSDAAMSSDALLSSDGCLSDVSRVGTGGSGHELDSTTNTTTGMFLSTPHQNRGPSTSSSRGASPSPQPPFPADVVNGNHHHHHHHSSSSSHNRHRTSTPAKRWGPGATIIVRSRSPSPTTSTASSSTPSAPSSSTSTSQGPLLISSSTPQHPPPHLNTPARTSTPITTTAGNVSERDVRYFMVDNYYGASNAGDNKSNSNSRTGGES